MQNELTVNRRNISPRADDDEWVFDTVKARTIAPAPQTAKRRKVARIPSSGADAVVNMMQQMDLEAAPLGEVTDSPLPATRRRVSARRNSQGTAFRISSGNTPTTRRISNAPKKPLGVDLHFGNSPSTVRHFKRVPSGERRAALQSNPPSSPLNQSFHPNPEARTFRLSPTVPDYPSDTNNENTPPTPEYAPMPVTKDALYGRRAYSKVLDSVFQEAHADTASPHQRDAIGRVAQAWQHLDEVDPHGEFMLLKAMVDRLKNDTKLASALGIDFTSIQSSPAKHNTQTSDTSLGGTTVHGTSTTRVRSSTSKSTTSDSKSSGEYTRAPSTPSQPPSATPMGTTSNSPLKASKLLLAKNNPHLKSHRRRQSAFVVGEKQFGADGQAGLDEKKFPGFVEQGMEQQGLLANILYGQWMQGLRTRWPIA